MEKRNSRRGWEVQIAVLNRVSLKASFGGEIWTKTWRRWRSHLKGYLGERYAWHRTHWSRESRVGEHILHVREAARGPVWFERREWGGEQWERSLERGQIAWARRPLKGLDSRALSGVITGSWAEQWSDLTKVPGRWFLSRLDDSRASIKVGATVARKVG